MFSTVLDSSAHQQRHPTLNRNVLDAAASVVRLVPHLHQSRWLRPLHATAISNGHLVAERLGRHATEVCKLNGLGHTTLLCTSLTS